MRLTILTNRYTRICSREVERILMVVPSPRPSMCPTSGLITVRYKICTPMDMSLRATLFRKSISRINIGIEIDQESQSSTLPKLNCRFFCWFFVSFFLDDLLRCDRLSRAVRIPFLSDNHWNFEKNESFFSLIFQKCQNETRFFFPLYNASHFILRAAFFETCRIFQLRVKQLVRILKFDLAYPIGDPPYSEQNVI